MPPVHAPRVGVFGGTFDPVHHGHLIAAAEFRFALDLSEILLVPNSTPPHKPGAPISATHHRVAMLMRAIQNVPWLNVDPIEIERGGPSYTVQTLSMLRQARPETELVFLMGEDSLGDLPMWRDPEKIVALAEVGVATRPGTVVHLPEVYRRIPGALGRIQIVEIPQVSVASRDLRQRVAEGRPITFQVPEAVERYITDHRLYRG